MFELVIKMSFCCNSLLLAMLACGVTSELYWDFLEVRLLPTIY